MKLGTEASGTMPRRSRERRGRRCPSRAIQKHDRSISRIKNFRWYAAVTVKPECLRTLVLRSVVGMLALGCAASARADGIPADLPLSDGVMWMRIAHNQPLTRHVADAASLCETAIARAEQRYALPPGLLEAVALVETGRRDRAGTLRPWPWAVNAQNQGLFFNSAAEAIAWVRNAQRKGIASIDIGCMQVNQAQHPDSFVSLNEAFAPEANVNYAARFLFQLHTETGDWLQAAGYYHSRMPALANPYRRQVAFLYENSAAAVAAATEAARLEQLRRVQSAWAATLTSSGGD